jgi:hypothetical protein
VVESGAKSVCGARESPQGDARTGNSTFQHLGIFLLIFFKHSSPRRVGNTAVLCSFSLAGRQENQRAAGVPALAHK